MHIGCEALFEKAVRSRRIAGLEVAQCEMPGKSITLPRAGKCSDETTARCSIGPVSGEASKQLPICRGTGSSNPSPSSRQSVSRPDPAAAGRKTRGSARVRVAAVGRDAQGLVEIARSGAVISVGRYSSTAVPVMCHRAAAGRDLAQAPAVVNFSSKAEQDVLLVPGQRQT